MENKEIYIDGVDVSDCKYFRKDDSCKNTCQYFCTPCEWVEIQNCMHKYAKNKEQECKALREEKAYTDMACKQFEKQLQSKEQECEKLKKDIERWKSNFNCKVSVIEELLRQLDQLKAENEELKKEREKKRDHYFIISNENSRLEDEKARLGYGLNCKIEKLKQALKEIKEIAEANLDKADRYLILQKISEVIDDKAD